MIGSDEFNVRKSQSTSKSAIAVLSQIHEVSNIDSEIIALHQQLDSLYRQRANITSVKSSAASVSSQSIDDINLDGIDLSL